jgi:predicted phosphodiesterase
MSRHFSRSSFLLAGLLLLLTACAASHPAGPATGVFQHDITGEAVPWTHASFDDEQNKFTFALFSDLTGGEREGVFNVAIAQLNLLRPELIVNVGDLIEGGTTDNNQLAKEWSSFDQRAGHARAPVFYTGGNHDLTNPDMWQVFEQRYGRRYYHFIYKDTLFLVLDTEDNPPEFQWEIDQIRNEAIAITDKEGWAALHGTAYGQLTERKSGRISAEQAFYFREVIAQNPQVRWTFVLMHKPAWERPDEENFSTVEVALEGRPYTVFYGHVHSYLYEQRHGRDYIRLATTGGVQDSAKDLSIDHVTLVTVSDTGVDIANLRLSGIFDKSGKIPAGGESLCFEAAVCGEQK